eukprot:2397898-Rhodomonas_salina.2
MNYASHAKELGKPLPLEPVIFSKGPNAITGSGSPIIIPKGERENPKNTGAGNMQAWPGRGQFLLITREKEISRDLTHLRVLDSEEPKVDFEGELAVIIGPRPCRDVSVRLPPFSLSFSRPLSCILLKRSPFWKSKSSVQP